MVAAGDETLHCGSWLSGDSVRGSSRRHRCTQRWQLSRIRCCEDPCSAGTRALSQLLEHQCDAQRVDVVRFAGQVGAQQRARFEPAFRTARPPAPALGARHRVAGSPRPRARDAAAPRGAAARRCAAPRTAGGRAGRRTRTWGSCAGGCAPARRGTAVPGARSRRCRSAPARRRHARGTGCGRWPGRVSCRRAAQPSIGAVVGVQRPAVRDLVEQAQRGGFHARGLRRRRCRSAASAPRPRRRADRRRRRGRACRSSTPSRSAALLTAMRCRPSASNAASSTSTPPAMIGRRSSDRPGRSIVVDVVGPQQALAHLRQRLGGDRALGQLHRRADLADGLVGARRTQRLVPAQRAVGAGELLELGADLGQRVLPALLRQLAVARRSGACWRRSRPAGSRVRCASKPRPMMNSVEPPPMSITSRSCPGFGGCAWATPR